MKQVTYHYVCFFFVFFNFVMCTESPCPYAVRSNLNTDGKDWGSILHGPKLHTRTLRTFILALGCS